MKKVLIYGAGAIGRGYLPRVFRQEEFAYYFVEKNETIRNHLNDQKSYTSYMTLENTYDIKAIPVQHCFEPGEEQQCLSEVDAVLVAVGPRNFMQLQKTLSNSRLPVICFENDSNLPLQMRKVTGNENVVFAIPDVITSNTAPKEFLKKDPISVITEQGRCFIDEKVKALGGDCDYVDLMELEKQWKAKLYLHNTPHCIAAYLGNLINAEFLHESMKHPLIVNIIKGTMEEMIKMLRNKHNIDTPFLEFYANKEIQRFSNSLLFDPISRVAREPFRKLARNERLIGAAALSLSQGIVPENLIKGIMAAFCFDKKNDPDYHIKYLINSLSSEDFLRIIIGLRPGEALFEVLIEKWSANMEIINKVKL